MNDVIKQLLERKSVRVFTDQEISKEDKELILECALQAPTAGNQSMYTIIDVTDQELLDKLSISCDNQPFIKTSKMCLIFCADFQKWYDAFTMVDKDARKPAPGDFLLSIEDTCIAAQSAVVAADSLQIGSCYIGDIMENFEYHKELLHLPEYVYPACMVVFGYPTDQQINRIKPARFNQKYMVHENYYHDLDKETIKEMFEERASRTSIPFEFERWMDAFYHRKYDSGFSKEMSRSADLYYKLFEKNLEK